MNFYELPIKKESRNKGIIYTTLLFTIALIRGIILQSLSLFYLLLVLLCIILLVDSFAKYLALRYYLNGNKIEVEI